MNSVITTSDVRQHILDVAYPLFLRKGFTAVGLTELLEAAEVPKGSFYHYFDSKEAFGETVLETYFNDQVEKMDRLLTAAGSAAAGLQAFFRDWLDSFTDKECQGRCLAVKMGAEVCDLSLAMRTALKRGTGQVIDRLTLAVQAGRKDASLSQKLVPETVAVTLYQMWLGASLLAKITRDRSPLLQALAHTRQILGLKRGK